LFITALRLRGDARGRDGGVREELAAGVVPLKPETEVEAPASCLLEREDCTLKACYRYIYAPRTGGAYDSHHRTAGIAGRTRRRGSCLAARAQQQAHVATSHYSSKPAGSALNSL
jgi:hypothetical protein